MQRCTTKTHIHTNADTTTRRSFAAMMALALASASAVVPALAQTATFAPFQGQTRNFPNHALRGTLVVNSINQANIDGQDLLLAPAFKLYNPQNMMVRPNTLLGQKLNVNYVIEKSSGRIHAAWILNSAEAALKRDRADNGFWSSLFK